MIRQLRWIAGLWLVLCTIVLCTAAFNSDEGRVRLHDIKTLTLYRGRYTTARRSSPIPQLQCTGGSAGCSHEPSVVQCYNMGGQGNDVQWRCEADLESTVRFGPLQVSCEGFNFPGDEIVLEGSCGLQYTLELTEEGRQKGRAYNGNGFYNSYNGYYSTGSGFDDLVGGFIFMIVIGIFAVAIFKACAAPPVVVAPPVGGANYAYGGYQMPPPVYTTGTGPGFFSGLATGGFLGSMFNRPYYGHGPSYGYGAYPTGGGAAPRPPSPPRSRTAAGYGGTNVR